MRTLSTIQQLTVVFLLVTFFSGIQFTANAQFIGLAVKVDFEIKQETCFKANDVEITVKASGGTGGYTYSIDGGNTFTSNNVFKNLSPSTSYTVVAKDSRGTIASKSTGWISPVHNPVTLLINDVRAADCSRNGYIKMGAWGGAGDFSFSIDGGHTFPYNRAPFNAENLSPGVYEVVAKDSRGCLSAAQQVTINAPYSATLTGDATVRANEPFTLKVTVADPKAKSNTRYTVHGKDNLGNYYSYADLKAGANEREFTTPVSLVFTIVSIEKQDASKCKGFVSGTATITVKEDFVWTGSKSSDWHTAANWSSNKVPGSTSDIKIVPSKNNPVIARAASAKSIKIEKGGKLKVAAALTLLEAISIDEKETVDASEGTLNYSGTSLQKVDGGMFVNYAVKEIIVGNDIELLDTVKIFGSIRFNKANKTFQTNDLLTLKSTASGTASVDKVINGNKITGKVTVENYIPARKGWKFLSVSTQPGQTINQAWQEGQPTGNTTSIQGYGIQLTGTMADWQKQGYDAKSPAPSIKTYNSNTNLWIGLPSTHAPFSHPSNAYMVFVRGDRSANAVTSPETPTVLRSQGELKTGDQPVVDVTPGKFIAVGNPYPADLDMSKINTSRNMFYYIWDQHLGNSYGAYQVFMRIDKNEFMAVPGGGTYQNLSENIIPAGQAFFAYNLNGGTLQITENSKAGQFPSFGTMREMAPVDYENNSGLKLRLYSVQSEKETLVDGIFQNIGKEFSKNIDEYDALKSTNTSENVSIKRAGKLLAIESISLGENGDTTLLNVTGMSAATYRFKVEWIRPLANYDAVLVDNFANTRTIMRDGLVTEYEFKVTNNAASYAATRFAIVYTPLRAMPVTFTSVKAEKNREQVNVSWKIENEVNVASYSVEKSQDGKNFNEVGKVSAGGLNQYRFTDNNPATGINYYRIVSVDVDGKKGYSSIAKATMEVAQEQISVNPNPIVGNNINLQMKLQAKGIYYISIKNQLGQYVDNKQISYDGGQSNFVINPSTKLSHGVYTIEVTHPSGERSVVRFIK